MRNHKRERIRKAVREMIGRKKSRLIAAVMLGLAMLTAGCGEDPGDEISGQRGEMGSGGIVDQGQGGILLVQGDRLYLGERLGFALGDQEEDSVGWVCADAWGSKFYILKEDAPEQYVLHIYDGMTGELEQQPFPLELSKEGYSVRSMEVKSPEQLSLRLRNIQGDEEGDILLETDMEGRVTRQEDSFPEEDEYPWNPQNSAESSRAVYDNMDGTAILSQWDVREHIVKLFWYDKEKQSRRVICELEDNPDTLYLDQSQMLYYVGGGRLVRRNLADQTEKELFSMQELPYSQTSYMALLPGAAGKLLFCVCEMDGKNLEVYVLSEEEPESVDEIRMAYLWQDSKGQATELAVEYSLSHQDCPIRAEQAQGDEEDFRSKILMELAAGKGPELMWVSRDDLDMLAEKGILMDMRELIPDDLIEQIFPSVIEAGTVDGTMVALAPQFTVFGLVVSNQVWDEGTWTLREFMDVVEYGEDWKYLMSMSNFIAYPMGCLGQMIPDLTDSPFLDMDQRKAHFDHEDFIRAITLCKEYGFKEGEQSLPYEEIRSMLKNGEIVCGCMDIYDGFPGFSQWMAQYSDICHFAGRPGSGGAGGWIEVRDGLLAVNAKAEHLEEIKAYIALLLDYENQLLMPSCCVRMDVTRECIVMCPTGRGTDETTGEPIQLYEPRMKLDLEGKRALVVELKPDGSTYLEEYMDFLEGCVVDHGWPAQIRAILVEELLPYFSGDKEMEDAVANIQNRVQLYLDEN